MMCRVIGTGVNTLSQAFAIDREFAFLVLLLCLVLAEDREIPPIPSLCAFVRSLSSRLWLTPLWFSVTSNQPFSSLVQTSSET
jgi:hypothetical protein